MATAEQLITENLDVWASTVQAKSAAGRGTANKFELYGIKKLRELILELAVRGLLVPQDPNDEPASELLKEITAEKARLVKEGILNKREASSEIKEDEKPFELPESWQWARLPDVCSYGPGKTPSTKNPVYWEEGGLGHPWVGISDMTHYKTVLNTAKCVSNEAAEKVFKSDPVKAGTLLMSFKLTVGKIAKLGVDAYHNEAIISVHPFKGVLQDYIYRFLPSRALAGNTKQAIMGATLNSKSLAMLLIPVPPEKEQVRIVAKVDELMALCDQLEQQQEASITAHQTLVQTLLDALTTASERDGFTAAWARTADHFDTLFTTEWSIDQLKQTILQLAVMGKLVPQDPNDEPASELLRKISAEKEQLVKDGTIKKQKTLPSVEGKEMPFMLPKGWEWASFSHLGVFSGGKTPSKGKSKYWGGDIPWVTPKDMKVMEIVDTEDYVTKLAVEDGLAIHAPGSVLFVVRSGILRRTLPVAITRVASTVNQDLKVLSPYLNELGQYIQLMARGFERYILKNLTKTGTTVESIVFEKFSTHAFMLPPLEEQNRIVAKVDELMTLCDALKAKLHTAQTMQLHLADAMSDQTVS